MWDRLNHQKMPKMIEASSRVLTFSSLLGAALGGAITFTPANIMNKYDFLKAEITSMDYTRQICPKSNIGALPECLKCYDENTCSMSMVGFESRVARHNPADPVDLTGPTTVLMASFIGAPTFIAGNFRSNGTNEFDPSFMGDYIAPETRETFWNAVGNNAGKRSPEWQTFDNDPVPYVYSANWYKEHEARKKNTKTDPSGGNHEQEVNLMVVLKEIIEFDDKNNNGQYDSAYDGKSIQRLQTECLSWALPKNKISFNKTVAFSGELSSWSTSSKKYIGGKTAPSSTCTIPKMPTSVPEGLISFTVETSNLPAQPSSPNTLYDTTPTPPLLVTQNGLKIKIRVKDFPFKSLGMPGVKGRLAFRFFIASDDYSSQFQLYDLRRLVNRKKPSHVDNGYFEWQANARVKFPGSENMFGDKYKEQPLRPSRNTQTDKGLPGASDKPGFIPFVGQMNQIPYSAVTQKLRGAYEDFFIEDLVLAIGGQAITPTDVEFEMFVAYGRQPIFKTWAGQPVVVIFVLFVMTMVCYCAYGGWGRDRDLQTGVTHADASQDILVRTTRELHEIRLKSKDPAHQTLLGKGKDAESHQQDSMDSQGLHFVWQWPCKCRVIKNSRGQA